jgi:hypothetical protein
MPPELEGQVRDLVVEALGDAKDGTLMFDDTQMIKKRNMPVDVAPQHRGATNQIENCQVVVTLAYARLADRGGRSRVRRAPVVSAQELNQGPPRELLAFYRQRIEATSSKQVPRESDRNESLRSMFVLKSATGRN